MSCSELQSGAVCVAVCCSVLQCVLQCVAVCVAVVTMWFIRLQRFAVTCSVCVCMCVATLLSSFIAILMNI